MVGSLARRHRRPLWGWLAFLLVIAIAVSMYNASRAKDTAIAEAAIDAKLTAQTELATLLEPNDLEAPVFDERATELTGLIDGQITSVSRIDEVRIFSAIGRILYADDPTIVGTRPSYLRELTFEVANGEAQTHVRGTMLQTFVPIWISPDGTVAVAEMSQALAPITSAATARWISIALICGVLLLGAVVMIIVTSLAQPSERSSMPVQVYAPASVPSGASANPEPAAVGTEAPLNQQPGFREIDELRRTAETRARASEQELRSVRVQLKDALAHVALLEEELTVQGTGQQDCDALRDRFRETSERLNLIEMENTALRERLHLREQELEEARARLRSSQSVPTGVNELRQRLEGAEERASQMAREMKRIETELDDTTTRFHMSRLTDALREAGHVDGETEEQDSPSIVVDG